MGTFKLGDKVWFASIRSERIYIQCPDCFGKKYLTVILGDDSRVTVECTGCQSGYEPPTGIVLVYGYIEDIQSVVISGIEITNESGAEKTEYRTLSSNSSSWHLKDENCFASPEDAKNRARQLAVEHSEKAMAEFCRKEKDTRSWAWNATYHRQCLKRALHDAAYHKSKLGIATIHAKKYEFSSLNATTERDQCSPN